MRYFSHLNEVAYAGLARRLAAMVYDLLLVLAVLFVFGLIGVGISDGDANESLLFKLGVWVVPFVFYSYFWRKSGQSLGMLAWQLRIQTLEGQPISQLQVFLRLIAALVSWACLGLGYWWILFDKEKRSWPDIFSNTQTVLLPKRKKN